ETVVSKSLIVIAGEICTNAELNYTSLVHDVLADIGIPKNAQQMPMVLTAIKKQSPEIVKVAFNGASDQAVVFGYATDETPEYMPLPIQLANTIMKNLQVARKTK